ncbi:MAG: PAC2 family protein [Dehalococcoidia bacterium]
MERDDIVYYAQPNLRKPNLVAAFLGWPDAAQVSTSAISYLIDKLPALKLAEIKSDEYYDFTKIRPTVNIESGIIGPLNVPRNGLYYWENSEGSNDLIFLTGIEPQSHWRSYAEMVADLAGFYKVHHAFFIGGLYDRIPHTRETRISGLVNDRSMMEVLKKFNIEPIDYNGPSSIHGLLMNMFANRRIPAASLWGHVPFYIRSESNPMVCLEIVKKLASILGVSVDLHELKRSSQKLYQILTKMLAENEQMNDFLKSLETQYDLEGSSLGTQVEGDDQIIKDIEYFLKRKRQDN